jgi:hypothetical protein
LLLAGNAGLNEKKETTMTRSALLGLGAACLAAVGVVGLAGSAGAAESSSLTGVIKQRTTSYSSPSNQTTPVHTSLREGTQVETVCFTDQGQTLNDNPYWFRVNKDGMSGYVHRDAISVGNDLPNCFG